MTVGDGYLAAQLATYHNHVNAALATMFSQEPFKTYTNYFNLYSVDVVSNESGVDHDPTYPIWRDTALDMGFWCENIERLLCVDVGKAYAYAQNAPDVDMVLAVRKFLPKYGGAGYTGENMATVAGGNSSAAEIALHEFGHSLGDLADEYDYGGGTYYVGPEPVERNHLEADRGGDGGQRRQVGAMAGGEPLGVRRARSARTKEANYYLYDIYRPTTNSRMRSLYRPFNLPSAESLVIEIYTVVRPIDDSTPTGAPLGGREVVYVTLLQPLGHALDAQWTLDGQPIAGATESTLDLKTLDLQPGTYTLGVVVVDNTWFVRDAAAREQWLTQRLNWTVDVVVLPGDVDCSGAVDFGDYRSVRAGAERSGGVSRGVRGVPGAECGCEWGRARGFWGHQSVCGAAGAKRRLNGGRWRGLCNARVAAARNCTNDHGALCPPPGPSRPMTARNTLGCA